MKTKSIALGAIAVLATALAATHAAGGTVEATPTSSKAGTATRALHLRDFNSPDRRVWCLAGSGYFFCGAIPSATSKSQHSGWIDSNSGKVRLCYAAVANLHNTCFQNWNSNARVLRYGQRTRRGPYRCVSRRNGITCIKISGRRAGNGFRINRHRVVRVR